MTDQWAERAAVIILGIVCVGGLIILAVNPSEVVGGMAATALGAIAMFVRGKNA